MEKQKEEEMARLEEESVARGGLGEGRSDREYVCMYIHIESVCVCVRAHARACVRVCACARTCVAKLQSYDFTHLIAVISKINEYRVIVYGVALVCRIDEGLGLFCKRALYKTQHSTKEISNFIDPTNRRHPIYNVACICLRCMYWRHINTYMNSNLNL